MGTSASPPPNFFGHWYGYVLMVYAEYDFGGDYNHPYFDQRTFSGNNVMISAHKGLLDVEGDKMRFNQKQRYDFSNETLTGQWITETKSSVLIYRVEDGYLFLKTEDGESDMILKKGTRDEPSIIPQGVIDKLLGRDL